jgi:1-acyl-sn-glycerol-3-phosphate acyltransferase
LKFTGDPAKARDRREVTDQVMAAIQGLSGQEYVAKYASGFKNAS